jgi:hypothetical protein
VWLAILCDERKKEDQVLVLRTWNAVRGSAFPAPFSTQDPE